MFATQHHVCYATDTGFFFFEDFLNRTQRLSTDSIFFFFFFTTLVLSSSEFSESINCIWNTIWRLLQTRELGFGVTGDFRSVENPRALVVFLEGVGLGLGFLVGEPGWKVRIRIIIG